jgi:hypothetical protein
MKVQVTVMLSICGYTEPVGDDEKLALELRVPFTGILSFQALPPKGMKLWLGDTTMKPAIVKDVDGVVTDHHNGTLGIVCLLYTSPSPRD